MPTRGSRRPRGGRTAGGILLAVGLMLLLPATSAAMAMAMAMAAAASIAEEEPTTHDDPKRAVASSSRGLYSKDDDAGGRRRRRLAGRARRYLPKEDDDDEVDDKKEDKPKKTDDPTYSPTETPTEIPKKQKPKKTDAPTNPTSAPTITPRPTDQPTVVYVPDSLDTPSPAAGADADDAPNAPKDDTLDTPSPAGSPVESPTQYPTRYPSAGPAPAPSTEPSASIAPTNTPTVSPTRSPSYSPTDSPSISISPTDAPSSSPTATTQPSSSPSGAPSSIPSSHPSETPSMQPTSSAMPSSAPIPYARSPRVDVRYAPWSSLSWDETELAAMLGYDSTTWDELGTNSIENVDWQRLTREQKNVARQLGYDLYSWDCWQNHFQSYRWVDLDLTYIQVGQWWEELGWEIYSWNRFADPPPSDGLVWYELGEDERAAAAQLCYFRESWDEGEGLVDGFPVERPEFRYRHWFDLDEEVRAVADEKLKYSALSWNVLGLSAIEGREWGGLTPYEAEAALGIGFTQLSWDCWQNHFRSYSWADLEFYGLDLPYRTLGWTELSWDGLETPPPSNGMSWKDISQEQRLAAASELCYFKDNWDGIDMTPNNSIFPHPKVKQRYVQWKQLPVDIRRMARDSLQYNETSWNTLGTAGIEKRSWSELSERQKVDAFSIGFYQRTWDCFQNHYRSYEWADLDRDSRDVLQVMGWSEISWADEQEPPSYNNTWDRLSENEQSVLPVLCFFEDNWDVNNLESVGIEQEEVVELPPPVLAEGGAPDVDEVGSISDADAQGSTSNPGQETDQGQGPDPGQETDQGQVVDPGQASTNRVPGSRTVAVNSANMAKSRRVFCVLSVAVGVLVHFLV